MAPKQTRPEPRPERKDAPRERVASPPRPESDDERAWRGHGDDDEHEPPLPPE